MKERGTTRRTNCLSRIFEAACVGTLLATAALTPQGQLLLHKLDQFLNPDSNQPDMDSGVDIPDYPLTPPPDAVAIASPYSNFPAYAWYISGEETHDKLYWFVTPEYRDCSEYESVGQPPLNLAAFYENRDLPNSSVDSRICALARTLLELPDLSAEVKEYILAAVNHTMLVEKEDVHRLCGLSSQGCYFALTGATIIEPVEDFDSTVTVIHELCHRFFDFTSPVYSETEPAIRFEQTALFENESRLLYGAEVMADICSGAYIKWLAGPKGYTYVITSSYVASMFRNANLLTPDPTNQVLELQIQMNQMQEWLVREGLFAELLNSIHRGDVDQALILLDRASTQDQSASVQGGINTILTFSNLYALFDTVFNDPTPTATTTQSAPAAATPQP